MLKKIKDYFPTYLHMLILFPLHTLIYELANHFSTPDRIHPVWCRVDEILGVRPWAVLPYCSWFFLILFTVLYTARYDTVLLRKFAKYCMVTSFLTDLVFLFWPSCVGYRPEVEVTGFCSWLLNLIHTVDNNCCALPSLHVQWAFGMTFAMLEDRRHSSLLWKGFWVGEALLITLSTMLTKQHSFLDTVYALPIIFLAWLLAFSSGDPAPLEPLPIFKKEGKHV